MRAAKDEAPPAGRPAWWSRADWEELKEYISWLRNQLGLRDWEIIMVYEIPDEEGDCNAIASIHPTDGRRRATLRLARDFRELDAEQQRNALIHELIHLHHRDATDIIRLTLPEALGGVAHHVLWENFRQQIELMVDNISVAVADRYPVISWPKPKKRKKGKRS